MVEARVFKFVQNITLRAFKILKFSLPNRSTLVRTQHKTKYIKQYGISQAFLLQSPRNVMTSRFYLTSLFHHLFITKSNENLQASWHRLVQEAKVCSGQYKSEMDCVLFPDNKDSVLSTFHLKFEVKKLCGNQALKASLEFSIPQDSPLRSTQPPPE